MYVPALSTCNIRPHLHLTQVLLSHSSVVAKCYEEVLDKERKDRGGGGAGGRRRDEREKEM